MYNDFYDNSMLSTTSRVDVTWMIVSAVLALVGGIAIYILFVSKKNNGQYKGFLKWLHNFLNFKVLFTDMILKVLYLMSAIFITLNSFSFIGVSVAAFFASLIFGNIIARIAYELVLMAITLVKNTTEINEKLPAKKTENFKPKKREKEPNAEKPLEEEN